MPFSEEPAKDMHCTGYMPEVQISTELVYMGRKRDEHDATYERPPLPIHRKCPENVLGVPCLYPHADILMNFMFVKVGTMFSNQTRA